MHRQRELLAIHQGRPTSDGAGVRLTRVFGGGGLERFDPFLMLDEFGSADPGDYLPGFPPHPHRGFETITYMLQGRMRHRDHLGHEGLLENGGVQWMSAARGIIHSEMPEQQHGVMRGFQIWLNLPARDKLGEPGYRDYRPDELPRLRSSGGVDVAVIAGSFSDGEQQLKGMVQRPHTEPQLFDLQLPAGSRIAPQLDAGLRVLLYVYEGSARINGQAVGKGQLARLGEVGSIELQSDAGASVLLLAGRPLAEPIVQYGPFVMNSREEIEQALQDFRDGRLA